MGTGTRPLVRRLALAVVFAVAGALLTLSGSSSADHQVVTAVQGSAYGYRAFNLTLFGGPQPEVGATPAVTLPPNGAKQTATAPTALVMVAETAVLLTSDAIRVTTEGTLGSTGSVTSSATLTNVNKATTQGEFTGGEVLTADTLASTCTASESVRSGDTTITNGFLQTDSGWDANEDGDYNDAGDIPRVVVPLPSIPTVGREFTGVVRFGGASNTPDTFRVVLNEQVAGPGQKITVNAAHFFYGVPGTRLRGEMIVGQSVCGVTLAAGPTTSSSTSTTSSTVTSSSSTSTTVAGSTTSTTAGLTTTTTSAASGLPAFITEIICGILRPLATLPFVGPFIAPLLVAFGCV